jgi:hypothetical protein
MAKHNLWCECSQCVFDEYHDTREPVGDDIASLRYDDSEYYCDQD